MIDKKFFKFLGSLTKWPSYVWIAPDGAACVSGRGWQAYLPAGSVPNSSSKGWYSVINQFVESDGPFITGAATPDVLRPDETQVVCSLSPALMKDIKSVLWALPSSRGEPWQSRMQGVCLELEDDVWRFIATDADVMHIRHVGYVENFWQNSPMQFLIPSPLARKLATKSSDIRDLDVVSRFSETGVEGVSLRFTLNGVIYFIESTSDFPDYKAVLPRGMVSIAQASSTVFQNLVGRCRLHPTVSLEAMLDFLPLPFEDILQMFSACLDGTPPKGYFDSKELLKLLKVWPMAGEVGIYYGKLSKHVNFAGRYQKDTVVIAAFNEK